MAALTQSDGVHVETGNTTFDQQLNRIESVEMMITCVVHPPRI